MQNMLELFSLPFMINAVIVGICVSICAALIGVILVQKKYSMIGHGLGEIGFASLAIALTLNLPPLAVSIPLLIISSCIILVISQKKNINGDTIIAIISSGALATGIIITSLSKGFNVDIYSYMFGSILTMTETEVILSCILSFVVITLFIVFYNRFCLITYDENYAKTTGINVTFYQFLIALITALVVVLGMRMMGTLMISSLIVFPAIISKKLTKSFKGLVICSAIVSIICFIMGLIISAITSIPTGASIVLINIILLIITTIINKFI